VGPLSSLSAKKGIIIAFSLDFVCEIDYVLNSSVRTSDNVELECRVVGNGRFR
jgi:hypothetical protein